MKTLLALVLAFAFLPTAFADNQKEQERVKESGEVLKEILNIPDDIPQESAQQSRVPGHSALS